MNGSVLRGSELKRNQENKDKRIYKNSFNEMTEVLCVLKKKKSVSNHSYTE